MTPSDIMRSCTGLVAVWLSVEPQHEEEFNAWYKFEHLAQMVTLDGFISARRYVSDWLYPRYLALYETEDETAEPGPAFAEILRSPTPWSARMRTLYGQNRMRHNYKRLACAMRDGDPYGAAVLLHQANAAPGRATDVEAWLAGNVNAALDVPGCTAARFYRAVSGAREYLELYEFENADALRTPDWHRFFAERRQGVARHLVDSIQQKHDSLHMSVTR